MLTYHYNESFTEPYYRDRNLSGQSPEIYGNNSYYQTTCYWTYGKGYTGAIKGLDPVHKGGYDAIGLTTINVSDANMMTKASINSKEIETISDNTTVPVIMQNGSWFKIYYNGHLGWINSADTNGLAESLGGNTSNSNTPNNIPNSNLPSVTITSPIGLWEGSEPSISAQKIVAIPCGTSVSVLGYRNGWYKIDYDGSVGWIDGQYTNKNGKPVGKDLVNNKSSKTKVIHINKNDKNNSNGKSNINHPSASNTNKKSNTTNTTKNTTSTEKNHVESKSSSKKNNTINNNKGKEISNGNLGKIRIESVLGIDLDSKINSSEITNIPNNKILNVLDQKDGWYKVDYNGQIGWIDSQFTSPLNQVGEEFEGVNLVGLTLSSKDMYLHSTSSAKIIDSIPNSTVLNLLGQQGNWYKVNYNGHLGWINKANLNVI